ncbi:MAG: hypothetical protein ACKVS9_16775 [Phycisphaerae bacterium]
MNTQPDNWTDEQLDAFRDGELEIVIADRLRSELLASAELRRRLARLERGDALAMVAMTTAARSGRRGGGWAMFVGTGVLASAAALLLVVSSWRDVRTDAMLPIAGADPVNDAVIASGSGQPYAFVRVVMTLANQTPKQKSAQDAEQRQRRERDENLASVEPIDPLLDAVRRAVDERRTDAAVALLSDAAEDQRTAGFQMLGESLRSALTAQSVLEQLSPAQQVEACGVWARDLELRPIALRKLRELRDASGTASETGTTLEKLMQDSSLRPWLRSYGLNAGG